MFEDLEDDFMEDEFSDEFADEGDVPPEEGNNRTFIMVAGGLGALTLLALICLAIYIFFIAPNNDDGRVAQEAQATQAAIDATELAMAVEATQDAAAWTDTPTVTPTPTDTPVPTEVVVVATDTPAPEVEPTDDPRTATVAALLTEAANQPTTDPSVATATPAITVTVLPDTGFADDFGVVGLVTMAVLALVIIFIARRLRTAN